eukprot:SAG31_NODE_3875_length_3793_cov_1.875203_3_plen_85_part_00
MDTIDDERSQASNQRNAPEGMFVRRNQSTDARGVPPFSCGQSARAPRSMIQWKRQLSRDLQGEIGRAAARRIPACCGACGAPFR